MPNRHGRRKGAKDIIPQSQKASIVAIIRDLVDTEPHLFRESIRRGISASPPKSFAYLQIAAAYLDGETKKRLELTGEDGGPVQVEAVRSDLLRAQLKDRLTRLLDAHPVVDVVPIAPSSGNGSGRGSTG